MSIKQVWISFVRNFKPTYLWPQDFDKWQRGHFDLKLNGGVAGKAIPEEDLLIAGANKILQVAVDAGNVNRERKINIHSPFSIMPFPNTSRVQCIIAFDEPLSNGKTFYSTITLYCTDWVEKTPFVCLSRIGGYVDLKVKDFLEHGWNEAYATSQKER